MIYNIELRAFHKVVTRGLISLIQKKKREGDNKDLNYWQPITLLTTIYKDFARMLRLRLQPI
jgi:hypothetical protein